VGNFVVVDSLANSSTLEVACLGEAVAIARGPDSEAAIAGACCQK
jgi:hypothetical protein